ncbi:MAG: Hsp20/alpha crystallin family protein [Anaerolineae bacterium]|nr:Hsp20/alpha crystallin family protein [Anaerolineae bacterium]MCO5207688.1 Hsp20/alpha crystallin family protein [Anaerolineae bacterium]
MSELTKTKEPNETTLMQQNERIFVPRVDIVENDDVVLLIADMPGVSADSVDITLEKNILTIKGVTTPFAPEGYDLVHREYLTGGYQRAFTLSDDVDRDNIEAKVSNGVLRLTLPKSTEIKTRRIPISN